MASATAAAIIRDALLELGVIQPGDGLPADLAAVGLHRFQNQIDAWSADRLTIAVLERVTATLVAGVPTMTIGTGGAINVPRPVWIDNASYLIPGASPAVEVPLAPMDDDSYANLSIKGLTSSLPQAFYYKPTTPLGTLFFWPTTTQNVGLVLYMPLGVAVPLTVNSVVTGPPGYQEAFMYQLARRLASPLGKALTPEQNELAAQAFAIMTKPNNQPGLLGVDAALVPRGVGAYNVLTDNSTGSSGR